MKKTLLLLKGMLLMTLMLISVSGIFAQTATPPSTGDGSAGNPYQIASLDNLYWLTRSDTAWDDHFIQTANIDASATSSWDGGRGPKPIGNKSVKFTGTYNGKGHTISNTRINRTDWRTDNHVGFFGYIGTGRIDSLGLINTNVDGYKELGVFASINEGTINHCYTKDGSIDCGWGEIMGGFVGKNHSTGIIQNCYSNIRISENAGQHAESEQLGGLVGANYGKINKCYATGRIYGNEDIGGLVGYNSGTITNCFATGNANGYYANNYGGIVGKNRGTIKYCYSTGDVGYYTYDRGGVVGENYGTVSNCFYQLLSDGGNGKGGTGLTQAQMKDFKNFLDGGWDYFDETYNGTESIWGQNSSDNNGYPFLDWQGYSNTSTMDCEAPLSSTKRVIFENISKNSFEVDSITTGGYITTGYAVYINTGNNWTPPTNNSIPTSNSVWQNNGQQCIYAGTSQRPEIEVTGLSSETEYFINTYTYRDCSDEELYQANGKIDSITTLIDNTPPSGKGTVDNPYKIATLSNLAWLMYNDTTWDKHFVQTANINASKTYTWNDSAGFKPIGNATINFNGSYNGKGYTIDSLYVNRPTTNYIGLFGRTNSNSQLDSIGLTNVKFNGKEFIGGLCGYNNGNINACYTTGIANSNPSQDARIGGLVGSNRKIITNSYSSVNLSASGGDYVGGLVGRNYGSAAIITNCFSTGNTSGRLGIGGFIGGNESSAKISYCYSTGTVTGTNTNYMGGFNGYTSGGVINNCLWDTETSGLTSSKGGTGYTTSEMTNYSTYLEDGWDFMDETYNGSDDNWGHNESANNGYPFLFWQGYTNNYTCEAPYSPSSEIIINNIQTTSFVIDSITNTGYGKVGTEVYINTENVWTIPAEGETPTSNNVWQGAGQQCVFIGSSAKPELTVSSLEKNKKYYLKAFAYNECEGTKKYEQTGLLLDFYTANPFTQPIGDGSEANPYEIASLENLTWLMYNDTVWDKNFIQTNDINASATIEWIDSTGFTPIGNSNINFTGKYNGKNHIIDSLCIKRETEDYIGLFGYTNGSQIDSLGLTDVNIKGNLHVGGLVAYSNGTINKCYTTGIVKGQDSHTYTSGYIGGLIGESRGTVTNCYSTTEVYSDVNMTGGLIGVLTSGSVQNSYTKGSTNGYYRVGGLVGYNRGNVLNCYSFSNIEGHSEAGGLVGYNYGSVNKSYSKGTSTGNSYIGGLIGRKGNYSGTTINSYWDIETSGLENSDGGTGKTTSEMKDLLIYMQADWDFLDESYNGTEDIWGLNSSDNSGYAFLSWQGYSNTASINCQAPLNPSTHIEFGDYGSDSIVVDSISKAGYITTGYVLYINSEDSFTVPADGDTPTANTVWQNNGQQCIYNGSSQTPKVSATNLKAGTKYFFKVYAYNSCSGSNKFEQEGYSIYKTSLPKGSGTTTDPYQIASLDNLEWLMLNKEFWTKHFIQIADIDARDTKNWDDGKGFTSIGSSSDLSFSGTYNGKGHTIDSLHIRRSMGALFGYTSAATVIDSLGLININFNTSSWTGSIVRYNYGTIRNSFATGKINAPNGDRVGGLVSHNMGSSGKLINCYTNIDITGASYVGGIAAFCNGSYIENCYSIGKVTATESHAGGMFPYTWSTRIINCYWDKETSGQTGSSGGTGKLSYQMKNRYTFIDAGWDFSNESDNGTADIWSSNCSVNDGYPFLSWQHFENNCEAPSEAVSDAVVYSVTTNSFKLESITPIACGTRGYVVYANTEDSWTNPTDGESPTANTEWQANGQQCIYNGTSVTPNVVLTNLEECETYFIKIYAYTTCDGTNLYETTGFVKKYGLVDGEAPIPDIDELPNITGQCSVTVSASPTATDNCAGTILGGTTDPFEYTEIGTYTITWIYSDDYGNITTQEQTIIVEEDSTAPVPDESTLSSVTGECSATVSGTPTATDNCSGSVTGTTTDPLTYSTQGTHTITWTYKDDNGNSSTQTQKVVIEDTTDPTIACVDDKNIQVESGKSAYLVDGTEFDPTSNDDNCEVASLVNDFNNTASLDGASFPEGTTTVTWTATDAAGNTATCNFDVTITVKTGIHSLQEIGVTVYPNPVNDALFIKRENNGIEKITVMDITGKVIIEKLFNSEIEELDMSGYAAGIYFISITDDKNVYTDKIIKR